MVLSVSVVIVINFIDWVYKRPPSEFYTCPRAKLEFFKNIFIALSLCLNDFRIRII